MATIDIVLVIPLAWSLFRGFRKGLILELAMLAGLVAGIYIGLHFSRFAADFIRDNFHIHGAYLPLLSFAVVFFLIMTGVWLIGKLLEKFAEAVFLGIFNKILGALFGMIKMALILSFFLLILNGFAANHQIISQEQQQKSWLYKPISRLAIFLIPKIKVEEIKKQVLPQA
jgi:membrane protein required for colicin V production